MEYCYFLDFDIFFIKTSVYIYFINDLLRAIENKTKQVKSKSFWLENISKYY